MPSHVELLRFDFDTNSNETIVLSNRERKGTFEDNEHTTALAHYTVKKPGVYRLHKVIDESKLEVQRRMSDTLVVRCPRVEVTATGSDKCLGDLSDLTMEIEGTPPLKIVYTRTANTDQSTHHFQSIQPENFVSPLLGSARASTLVVAGSQEFSWARSHKIKVPLNESMTPGGKWMYSIDEIHDATGNVANFSARGEDGEHLYPKGRHLEQSFSVHERPLATLSGCDSRKPMMVANGNTGSLPIEYLYSGRTPDRPLPHTLTWKFSPLDTLTASGDHGNEAVIAEYFSKNKHDEPTISQAGLYTLTGIKSQYCEGEVREPASCLLLNPPEPELSITAENINDKCAGSSIGLLVDLDLIGTPPFVVRYDIMTRTGTHSESVKVPGLRYQLELKPKNAGHFKYQFTSIDDAVYKGHQLNTKTLALEQDVKPPASAWLTPSSNRIDACIEEPVEINVKLAGETPFTLEYELVHDGKRKREKVGDINSENYKIKTNRLLSGGEYSLALASVKDKTGCKIFLNDQVKFTVRHQRPKASFGHLEGKRRTTDIAGKEIALPLRLTGRGPWTIKYQNLNDTAAKPIEKQVKSTNDFIKVHRDGVYKILEVSDEQCPGTVDPLASTFEVEWLPRPQIRFADTAVLIPDGNKFVKREVCEGDIDAVEVNLIGERLYFLQNFPMLTFWKAHRHTTSSIKFVTSPSMALARSATGSSTRLLAWPPFQWTLQNQDRTSTNSQNFLTASTNTTPRNSHLSSLSKKSTENHRHTSSSQDGLISTAKRSWLATRSFPSDWRA
jgi:nucleoporin POM152